MIAAWFGVLHLHFRHKDRRLLRNRIFLIAALWFAVWGILTLVASVSPPFGLAVVFMVVLAVFAIINGVRVIRAEGPSRATSLPLLLPLSTSSTSRIC